MRENTVRWGDLSFGLVVLASSALVAIGGTQIASGDPTPKQLLAAVILATLIVGAAVAHVLRANPPFMDFSVGWLYAAPMAAVAVFMTFTTNGVGPALPHQVTWGLLALLFGYATVARQSPRAIPAWLVVYATLGIALQYVTGHGGVLTDIGLSTVGLLVMWQVACSLRQPGGVMQFLKVVAIAYWAISALAVIVAYGHFALGTLNPANVALPWQISISNVLVDGNAKGYGFITTQAGKEISFVVCAYHFVRWQSTRTSGHATLAILAGALFISGYGRVPLIGGVLGLAVIALTNRYGTRTGKLVLAAAAVAIAISATGVVAKFNDLSSRGGKLSATSDSGHTSLWSQHLGLAMQTPLTGVGTRPTDDQIAVTWLDPLFHPQQSLPPAALLTRGSRGEGGWTGLLAQRGIVDGGIIVGLLLLGLAYVFRPFPSDPLAQQDMTVLRAVIPASLIFCITDVAPFSLYTAGAYVLGQLTMLAVVRMLR